MRIWNIGVLLLALALGCAGFSSPRRVATDPNPVNPTTGISGDPQAGLQQVNDYLLAQGYQPVGSAVRNSEMPGGAFLAYPINTRAGGCYAAVAVANGNTNLDMVLLDPAGRTIEYNVEPDHHPWITFCADRPGRYSVRLQMARGNGGTYLYGLYEGRAPTDLRALAGGGTAPTAVAQNNPAVSAPSADMEREFSLTNADILARGYEPMGEARRAELGQGAMHDLALNLEGGKCYALLAVGDRSVQDLDVILLDANGRQIDRDVEINAKPIVRVCPETAGSFTMQIAMTAGRGHFAYAAYRWPRGTRGAFGLAGLIYVRLMEVTQLLQVEGFAPDFDFSPGQGELARQSAVATHDLTLPAGNCYAVLVVGGDGVVDLDVALARGGSPVATDDSHNAFPNVRYCPTQAGTYSLAIRAGNGSGPYFYQVFKQQ